jgi:hypothetical protein
MFGKRRETADKERTGRLLDAVDKFTDGDVAAMENDPGSFQAVVAFGVFGDWEQEYPPPGHTYPRP